jgi:hypothetical protein
MRPLGTERGARDEQHSENSCKNERQRATVSAHPPMEHTHVSPSPLKDPSEGGVPVR